MQRVIEHRHYANYHLFHFRSNPTRDMTTTEYLFSCTSVIKLRVEMILKEITVPLFSFSANRSHCKIIPGVDHADLKNFRKIMLNIYNMPDTYVNTSKLSKSEVQFEAHILNELSDFAKQYGLDCAQIWAEKEECMIY